MAQLLFDDMIALGGISPSTGTGNSTSPTYADLTTLYPSASIGDRVDVLTTTGTFFLGTKKKAGTYYLKSAGVWAYFSAFRGVEIYDAGIDYAIARTLLATNGKIYTSLQTPNLNNEPSASPLYWGDIAGGGGGGALEYTDIELSASIDLDDRDTYAGKRIISTQASTQYNVTIKSEAIAGWVMGDSIVIEALDDAQIGVFKTAPAESLDINDKNWSGAVPPRERVELVYIGSDKWRYNGIHRGYANRATVRIITPQVTTISAGTPTFVLGAGSNAGTNVGFTTQNPVGTKFSALRDYRTYSFIYTINFTCDTAGANLKFYSDKNGSIFSWTIVDKQAVNAGESYSVTVFDEMTPVLNDIFKVKVEADVGCTITAESMNIKAFIIGGQ